MKDIIFITFITFIIFIIFIKTSPVYALSLPPTTYNLQPTLSPASPFYFLKSAEEVLELKFAKTSQEKGHKYFELAARRISEVESLINVNRSDLIPPVLERYWFNLSRALGLLNLRDDSLASQITGEIRQQIVMLEDLQNQIDNRKAKIAIRTAVYRIFSWNNSLSERLTPQAKTQLSLRTGENNNLICSFLSKEASSSALNQTEQYVLSIRAEDCFKKLKTQ